MSAYTEYAAMVELATSLHRRTDVKTLTKLAAEHATIEFPVSGDMLAITQRDTRTGVYVRRLIVHRALEGRTL